MVGCNMLLEIHKRLQGVLPDIAFGGVSILADGDLYQLPPVGHIPVFSCVSDSYAKLYRSGSLWVDEFQKLMIKLDEIMRQKDDSEFRELLCRIRTADQTEDDIVTLQFTQTCPTILIMPYRLNVDVDERNSHMLNAVAPESQQCTIKASDAIAGQTSHVNLSNLSEKRSETGGLHSVLKLAIGARVMLTTNNDVSDGLVNGARGTVVHVACDSDGKISDCKITDVLVQFDSPVVGQRTRQSSRFRDIYSDAVPLKKHEAVFFAGGKCGSEITRVQFPLTLAWASTIHKIQGLTLDEVVVDIKGGHFSPGQACVAFSQVKKLEGLRNYCQL